MDAEIISVGTELVLGQVTNTNVPLDQLYLCINAIFRQVYV